VADGEKKPSEERPPDVEIGAVARARSIRFEKKPEVSVRFTGESVEEAESVSRRRNLPDEVEPGKTYRDVTVGWRAAAWVENAAESPPDEDRT
jgi:hypothetical protein